MICKQSYKIPYIRINKLAPNQIVRDSNDLYFKIIKVDFSGSENIVIIESLDGTNIRLNELLFDFINNYELVGT